MKDVIQFSFLLLSFSFLLFTSSCEEKDDETLTQTPSELIGKIETSYTEGMTKVETVYTDGCFKLETSVLMDCLESRINSYEKSYSLKKKSIKSAYGDRVGVIKQRFWSIPPYTTGCGEYDELWVYMDCEDNHSNSGKSGWVGATVVNDNVLFKFCLVPKSLFSRSKYHKYAVLKFDLAQYGNNEIERYFDNEDNGNNNYVKLNGNELEEDDIFNYFGYGLVQNVNTTLFFHVYKKDANNGSTTFPNLGIQYGVFGTLSGKSQGWVYTDDEDNSNNNKIWYNWDILFWCDYGCYVDMTAYNEIKDMIEPTLPYDDNTTLHMSRVQ